MSITAPAAPTSPGVASALHMANGFARRYPTLVIDPPWPFNSQRPSVKPSYATMPLDQIKGLPIADGDLNPLSQQALMPGLPAADYEAREAQEGPSPIGEDHQDERRCRECGDLLGDAPSELCIACESDIASETEE